MRITAIKENRRQTTTSTFTTRLARQAGERLMSGIRIGSLVLEENGSVKRYGQPREQSSLEVHIQVKDEAAWLAIMQDGSVGAGEAYMLGYWETPDLLKVVRLMVLNMQVLYAMQNGQAWWRRMGARLFHLARRNSLQKAKANISAHYDLSNDFFSLMLDATMAYSSGIYQPGDECLEAASRRKFDHICRRLQLSPQDHLLEIGTGWGGLAVHAAKHYGCKVTSTTLSREQYRHAQEWVQREGLADRITLLEQDYRDLRGQYDKLVSVEMIEAVGAEYYDAYFSQCSSLLKPQGLMLIQAITISDQRYAQSVKNVDFIKRYIFPGGQLPCNAVIADHLARHTDMQLIGLEDITFDYARTLHAWRQRFHEALPAIRSRGADEAFIRMWDYYLCFCEGGFLERVIHTAQFLMAKPGFRQLPFLKTEPIPAD